MAVVVPDPALTEVTAEQLTPDALVPYQGDGSLASLGMGVVVLSYGDTPLAKVTSDKLAAFSVANILLVEDHPKADKNVPQLVLVTLPNRPSPYSLENLAKSGKGMIDQPLVLCGFSKRKSRKSNHVEVSLPKGEMSQVISANVLGLVTTGEEPHPLNDFTKIPAFTFIPIADVFEHGVSLAILGPRCRFRGRVTVSSAKGSPLVRGTEKSSATLRYVFPGRGEQVVYSIEPSCQTYSIPGISWDRLSSATHDLPPESQASLFDEEDE
jgi:hypothetical protein